VTELKDHEKVTAYFQTVISRGDEEMFDSLARYMVSDLETWSQVQGPESNVERAVATE
jgi:hypothetical protein